MFRVFKIAPLCHQRNEDRPWESVPSCRMSHVDCVLSFVLYGVDDLSLFVC